MSAIRVVIHGRADPAGDEALLARTRTTRAEPGCLQAEDFRSTEANDHRLHLELWEDAAAWDRHWAKLLAGAGTPEGRKALDELAGLQAPFHGGAAERPRATGLDGVEFYPQRLFTRAGPAWTAVGDAAAPASIRWPAHGAIRIVIQVTLDPAVDPGPRMGDPHRTRAEPGCQDFEFFRGLEHPENLALSELWASPEIYDLHWRARLRDQAAAAPAQGAAPAAPPARRYGATSLEWYHHTFYARVGDVWMPENPAQRMATVLW